MMGKLKQIHFHWIYVLNQFLVCEFHTFFFTNDELFLNIFLCMARENIMNLNNLI